MLWFAWLVLAGVSSMTASLYCGKRCALLCHCSERFKASSGRRSSWTRREGVHNGYVFTCLCHSDHKSPCHYLTEYRLAQIPARLLFGKLCYIRQTHQEYRMDRRWRDTGHPSTLGGTRGELQRTIATVSSVFRRSLHKTPTPTFLVPCPSEEIVFYPEQSQTEEPSFDSVSGRSLLVHRAPGAIHRTISEA